MAPQQAAHSGRSNATSLPWEGRTSAAARQGQEPRPESRPARELRRQGVGPSRIRKQRQARGRGVNRAIGRSSAASWPPCCAASLVQSFEIVRNGHEKAACKGSFSTARPTSKGYPYTRRSQASAYFDDLS